MFVCKLIDKLYNDISNIKIKIEKGILDYDDEFSLADELIFNNLEPLMPSSWNSSCVWLFKRWKILLVGVYLRVCAPPSLPNTWKAFLYSRESQNPSRIRKLSRKRIQDRAGHVHGCPHGQTVWKNRVIGLQYMAVAATTARPCGTGPKLGRRTRPWVQPRSACGLSLSPFYWTSMPFLRPLQRELDQGY